MIELPDEIVDRIPVAELPVGTIMQRISSSKHDSCMHFGKTGLWRWDAPDRGYGVLYAAKSVDAAFSETMGHQAPSRYTLGEMKFVGIEELGNRNLHELTTKRILRLADFIGQALPKLNLDAGFVAAGDYELMQALSAKVRDAGLDGIRYHPRTLPADVAYALFEHVGGELEEHCICPLHDWSDGISGDTIYHLMERQGWYPVPMNHT